MASIYYNDVEWITIASFVKFFLKNSYSLKKQPVFEGGVMRCKENRSGKAKTTLSIPCGKGLRNPTVFAQPGRTAFGGIACYCRETLLHLAFWARIWYHTLQYAFTVLYGWRIKF